MGVVCSRPPNVAKRNMSLALVNGDSPFHKLRIAMSFMIHVAVLESIRQAIHDEACANLRDVLVVEEGEREAHE